MPKFPNQKRRKGKVIARPVSTKKDKKVLQFEALPNEIICHVFSYLKLVDLLRCGQVSKRFRTISSDDQYLWPKKINLCYKNVPVAFLQKLLNSGCKYLSLCESFLIGTLNLQKVSSLKYLNLDAIKCDTENSEKLLEYCYSLEKLSLSEFYLSSKLINFTSLQNGKTLRVLDLSYCTFYREYTNGVGGFSIRGGKKFHYEDTSERELACIWQIVKNCTELRELSLYKTMLHKRSIDFLASNLTSNIEKLDLCNQNLLRDRHVKKLVTRCNKITELNLGGITSITKKSLNFIVEHLQETLVQLNLDGTDAYLDCATEAFKLRSMKKLKFLSFDNREDWNHCFKCRELKEQLINRRRPCFPFTKWRRSRIAIPHDPKYGAEYGNLIEFWEIKAEQEELFSDCSEDED